MPPTFIFGSPNLRSKYDKSNICLRHIVKLAIWLIPKNRRIMQHLRSLLNSGDVQCSHFAHVAIRSLKEFYTRVAFVSKRRHFFGPQNGFRLELHWVNTSLKNRWFCAVIFDRKEFSKILQIPVFVMVYLDVWEHFLKSRKIKELLKHSISFDAIWTWKKVQN